MEHYERAGIERDETSDESEKNVELKVVCMHLKWSGVN